MVVWDSRILLVILLDWTDVAEFYNTGCMAGLTAHWLQCCHIRICQQEDIAFEALDVIVYLHIAPNAIYPNHMQPVAGVTDGLRHGHWAGSNCSRQRGPLQPGRDTDTDVVSHLNAEYPLQCNVHPGQPENGFSA